MRVANRRPDTVLSIRNLNNKDDNRIYIFDAKYRINIVPIKTGTRPVTYTTLYLLKNSENTQELKVESSLETLVYKILKKIDKDKDTKTNKKDKVKEYIIGNVVIEIVDGIMIKVNGNKTFLRKLENEMPTALYTEFIKKV